jgi:two-component system C4-dicarboxylate transport sensor histidine kinase DctB
VVTVVDNGPGVEPAQLPKVFEPFFTTKGVGEGIGIGLSIVDNIIRDFGGTITVDNRPEGGACFTITLQAAEPDVAGMNERTTATAEAAMP